MEEENPIKEYLFEHIKKSEQKFQKLFSQEKMNEIIENILDACYDKASEENKEENVGILATGIMHYMLTNTMITSQRKVEFNGIQIDIVIPDLKTLKKDPKKSLIICIPDTPDREKIKEKIEDLQKVQPEKENIWIVTSKDLGLENKTYEIKKGGSFVNIIFDIARFVNIQGNNKFKILRV